VGRSETPTHPTLAAQSSDDSKKPAKVSKTWQV